MTRTHSKRSITFRKKVKSRNIRNGAFIRKGWLDRLGNAYCITLSHSKSYSPIIVHSNYSICTSNLYRTTIGNHHQTPHKSVQNNYIMTLENKIQNANECYYRYDNTHIKWIKNCRSYSFSLSCHCCSAKSSWSPPEIQHEVFPRNKLSVEPDCEHSH